MESTFRMNKRKMVRTRWWTWNETPSSWITDHIMLYSVDPPGIMPNENVYFPLSKVNIEQSDCAPICYFNRSFLFSFGDSSFLSFSLSPPAFFSPLCHLSLLISLLGGATTKNIEIISKQKQSQYRCGVRGEERACYTWKNSMLVECWICQVIPFRSSTDKWANWRLSGIARPKIVKR